MEQDPTKKPETDQIREEVGRTEYEMLIKNNDGEAEVIPMKAIRYRTKQNPEDILAKFEPATPAKITPTKRKKAKNLGDFILVYGDAQIGYRRFIDPETDEQSFHPLHSEAALSVVNQLNEEFKPPVTVNLGDFADFPDISRFDPDSNDFNQTMRMSMQRVHDFYAQLNADNPSARHIEVDSNHNMRPRKAGLKNMPALHKFIRPGDKWPLLSYMGMANLDGLVEFISGYGNAEYVHGEEYGKPPIVFKHGSSHSSAPGATVRKESAENPEVHIVRGHGHRDEEVRRTMRNGWQLVYKMIGTTCLNRGPVPGYNSSVDDFGKVVANQNPHQNTIMMIEDFKNGHYNFTSINIIDGIAHFNGKQYNGNE